MLRSGTLTLGLRCEPPPMPPPLEKALAWLRGSNGAVADRIGAPAVSELMPRCENALDRGSSPPLLEPLDAPIPLSCPYRWLRLPLDEEWGTGCERLERTPPSPPSS